MTVFIGGNSHCGAIRQGLARVEGADQRLTVDAFGSNTMETLPFSAIRGGRVEFVADCHVTNLQAFSGKSHFDPADVWGICAGTHYNRVLRAPQWRGLAAPSAIAGPRQRPISAAMLDAMLEADQAQVCRFLTQLKTTGVPVFAVACAPVRRDGYPADRGVPLGVTHAIATRAQAQFLTFLKAQGIAFVAPPPEAIDAEGFLLPAFCQMTIAELGTPDLVHANPEYGALMVRRILDHVAAMG